MGILEGVLSSASSFVWCFFERVGGRVSVATSVLNLTFWEDLGGLGENARNTTHKQQISACPSPYLWVIWYQCKE